MLPQAEWPKKSALMTTIAQTAPSTRVTARHSSGIAHETPSMVAFRARLNGHPRWMRKRGRAPLAMFPAASAAKGIHP